MLILEEAMKNKTVIILVTLLAVLLTSCELAYRDSYQTGTIWFVGYAADYDDGIYTSSGKPLASVSFDFDGKSTWTLAELLNTKGDAEELNKAFKALSDKAGTTYKSIMVFNASWEKYQETLQSELNPEKNDIVIFSFGCHGSGYVGEKDVSYGSDKAYKRDGIAFYEDSTKTAENITYEKLYKFVEDNFTCTKFFIYDVCHAGSAIVGDGVTVNKDVYDNVNPASIMFNHNINQKSSIWTLSAATYFQQSFENNETGHGAFTTCLLDALGWDFRQQKLGTVKALSGNTLSAGSIARYIYSEYGKELSKEHNQNPVFSAGSSDIILYKF